MWSFSRAENGAGSVEMPVESAISRRRDVKCARNSGNTRSGFDEIFSSSRHEQSASAGESETRKFAEMSSARSVLLNWGSADVRKDGTELGVLDPPISRCVIPG